ncbi:MAG: hypothetical protein GF308_05195 [Candidatus Heimdallarchaeota archaeon]|nr:hypothetical protein [Candidatus Heimdallarchaeota archaeon]
MFKNIKRKTKSKKKKSKKEEQRLKQEIYDSIQKAKDETKEFHEKVDKKAISTVKTIFKQIDRDSEAAKFLIQHGSLEKIRQSNNPYLQSAVGFIKEHSKGDLQDKLSDYKKALILSVDVLAHELKQETVNRFQESLQKTHEKIDKIFIQSVRTIADKMGKHPLGKKICQLAAAVGEEVKDLFINMVPSFTSPDKEALIRFLVIPPIFRLPRVIKDEELKEARSAAWKKIKRHPWLILNPKKMFTDPDILWTGSRPMQILLGIDDFEKAIGIDNNLENFRQRMNNLFNNKITKLVLRFI